MRDYLEYLRIPYQHQGRGLDGADCFGLVRLFYERELGATLPDFAEDYPEEWCTKHNYFLDLYDQYGFEATERHDFGNLILFRNTTVRVGHVGIILDCGQFLHMTRTGCAINDYLTGPWRRQVAGIYQLKTETV